jgi:hypothetical protein
MISESQTKYGSFSPFHGIWRPFDWRFQSRRVEENQAEFFKKATIYVLDSKSNQAASFDVTIFFW